MPASIITRALQLIFAIVVLALSIRASKWQVYGSVPATTAFAVLVSLVGIASIWISAIPALIMSMVDGLASVLLLAGGIVSPRNYLHPA
jgi:tetrahydromethanopterin S-methyltransferase subunit E